MKRVYQQVICTIRTLFLAIVIAACSRSTTTESLQTPIAPSVTPSSTLSPTLTPTPTTTFTPVPLGIELNYLVVASDYQAISITITISNISSSEIILYRLASPTPDAIPPISEFNIETGNGQILDYTLENWTGEADRHLQVLTIKTGDSRNAIVAYTLDLRSQTYWQVTPQYIAVAENQIFFQPDADNLNLSRMQFRFSVPANWNVVTRLTPEQDGYNANIKDTFRVITYNHNWQRFFLAAPLVLGEFGTIETRFNNIRLLAAYPIGNTQYAEDASYVGKIFALQESIFGDPSLDNGDYAILYVFGPKIPNGGGLIPTVESHGTFETAHVNDDRHLAHEMYHMWWGDGHFEPDAWRFIRVPGWFSEGTNEYLGVDAHFVTGAFTPAMSNEWHNRFYTDYRTIAGTPNDVPVSMCLDSLPFRSPAWVTCLYSKSHTVFYLLDQTLNHLTDQKIGLVDLIKYLLDKYSADPSKTITEDEILTATTDISGYDFQPFFDAYVTGNELLPVEIHNGQLNVIWNELPELSKH